MKNNKTVLLWIFVAAALLVLTAALLLRGCSAADTGTGTAGPGQTASTAAAAGEEEDQDAKDPSQTTAATEGMLDAVVGVDVRDEEAVMPTTETEAATSGEEKPTSTVKPTEPGSGAAGENALEGTQAGEPTDTDSTTATTPSDPPRELTYEEYLALCAEDQLAYMNSFRTVESYIQWFDAAKKEYDENNKGIEITGPIDLEDYLKP